MQIDETGAMIGVILAGGDATRMGGGDKGFVRVGGIPILERVVATLGAQCDDILISANGDADRFARFGCRVIADHLVADEGAPRRGPLAGILAALDWVAERHGPSPSVVIVPTDTPFLPDDLAIRLKAARETQAASIACARSAERLHPVVALWTAALREDLRRALDTEGLRKVQLFFDRHRYAAADWPVTPYDPFFNVNTPADRVAAETIAAAWPRQHRLADPPPTRL